MKERDSICDECGQSAANEDLQMCAECGMDALCFECITDHDCARIADAEVDG